MRILGWSPLLITLAARDRIVGPVPASAPDVAVMMDATPGTRRYS
jgi:hypothetical protein